MAVRKKRPSAYVRWMSRTGRTSFSPEVFQTKLRMVAERKKQRKLKARRKAAHHRSR